MEKSENIQEYKGKFWLSNKPDYKVEGVLKFTNNEYFRPILELSKPLINSYEESQEDGKKVITSRSKIFSSDDNIKIFGILNNLVNGGFGYKVSLHKCIPDNEGMSALEVFIGDDFVEEIENLNMEGFSIDYNLLSNWIGKFEYIYKQKDDRKYLELQFNEPKPIENKLVIGENKYNIDFVFSLVTERDFTSICVKEPVNVIISNDINNISFSEVSKLAECLRVFLNFATMEEIKIEKFFGYSKRAPEDPLNNYSMYKTISYLSLTKNIKHSEEEINNLFMLFSYKTLLDNSNFSNVFQRWIQLYEDLELGFINTLFTHSVDPIYYFWSLTPRIESYFRKRSSKSENENDHKYIVDKNIYSRAKSKLLDVIHTLYKDEEEWEKEQTLWKSRINFLNEVPLETILDELINENKEIILESKIMKESEIMQFIKGCKNTRNYFAHRDNKKKKKILKGINLLYLANRLKLIFIILILKKLGFKDSNIVEAINRARGKTILP